MIRVVHPGSRILMLTFFHPGSRGQKGTLPNPGSGSATLAFWQCSGSECSSASRIRIRIRIRYYLYKSRSFYQQTKKGKNCFVTSSWLVIFEDCCKFAYSTVSERQKNLFHIFFIEISKATKKSRIQIRNSVSGPVSKCHESRTLLSVSLAKPFASLAKPFAASASPDKLAPYTRKSSLKSVKDHLQKYSYFYLTSLTLPFSPHPPACLKIFFSSF